MMINGFEFNVIVFLLKLAYEMMVCVQMMEIDSCDRLSHPLHALSHVLHVFPLECQAALQFSLLPCQ